MTRMLGDDLADLITPVPQPEIDPDAVELADGDGLAPSDDELAAMVAGLPATRQRRSSSGAAAPLLYAGRPSSRAALFGDGVTDGSGLSPHQRGAQEQLAAAGAAAAATARGVLTALPPAASARLPTMFVNGHKPRLGQSDDALGTSSSSSSQGDEDEDEEPEEGDEDSDRDGTGSSDHGASEESSGKHQQQQQQRDAPEDSSGGSPVSHSKQPRGSNGRAGIADVAVDPVSAAANVAALLGGDAEMQALEREAAAVQAETAAAALTAGARSERDVAKAAGVRAQRRLWGGALETRIRLQRALTGANALPRPAAHTSLVAQDEQIARGMVGLRSAAAAALSQLLELHDALIAQHPAAAAAAAATAAAQPPNRKRRRSPEELSNSDAAWEAVEGAVSDLSGFRDAALDRWHRRTVLASGAGALRGSSGLRALGASVSQQVASLMADTGRLVARSRLPVSLVPRRLGEAAVTNSNDDDAAAPLERERDPETYDEADFYAQLLRELLDAAPPGSLSASLGVAGAVAKRRKTVDRRASKGRKLRYQVMEKLVGFMAPVERQPPPYAAQLFHNLFAR